MLQYPAILVNVLCTLWEKSEWAMDRKKTKDVAKSSVMKEL